MSDDHWHRPLFQIRAGELTGDTGQTSGMTRREAISGKSVGAEKLWMGQTHVAAGAKSGNHHHGEAETASRRVMPEVWPVSPVSSPARIWNSGRCQ